LGLATVATLTAAGAQAAVIGGDRVFAKPILDALVKAFQEDRHPKEQLRVVCQGDWEYAEAFGRGQSAAMLTMGPPADWLRAVVAQHSPNGNFIRWEKLEIGQVRVIAVINAANTVPGLTFAQVQKLLSSHTLPVLNTFQNAQGLNQGAPVTWNDLGGQGGLVTCYGEDEESASRQILRQRVMSFKHVQFPGEPGSWRDGEYPFRDNFALCADAREVIDEIARDRNGIGLITFTGQLPKEVRLLPLAEKPGAAFVTPKLEPVAQQDYPLCLPILLHVHPLASQSVRDFVQWASGSAGTEVLRRVSGYAYKAAEENRKGDRHDGTRD
jgi:hypothetical protein